MVALETSSILYHPTLIKMVRGVRLGGLKASRRGC